MLNNAKKSEALVVFLRQKFQFSGCYDRISIFNTDFPQHVVTICSHYRPVYAYSTTNKVTLVATRNSPRANKFYLTYRTLEENPSGT